jgi:hypothetical protein
MKSSKCGRTKRKILMCCLAVTGLTVSTTTSLLLATSCGCKNKDQLTISGHDKVSLADNTLYESTYEHLTWNVNGGKKNNDSFE